MRSAQCQKWQILISDHEYRVPFPKLVVNKIIDRIVKIDRSLFNEATLLSVSAEAEGGHS